MPSKSVRSYKHSGMKKYTDGGVAAQGFPKEFNSTYPCNDVDSDSAEDAPVNEAYVERLPSKIEPLGSVDLGSVNQKAK